LRQEQGLRAAFPLRREQVVAERDNEKGIEVDDDKAEIKCPDFKNSGTGNLVHVRLLEHGFPLNTQIGRGHVALPDRNCRTGRWRPRRHFEAHMPGEGTGDSRVVAYLIRTFAAEHIFERLNARVYVVRGKRDGRVGPLLQDVFPGCPADNGIHQHEKINWKREKQGAIAHQNHPLVR